MIVQAIPYMGPISGGLKEGMSVAVKGVAPLNMTRLVILGCYTNLRLKKIRDMFKAIVSTLCLYLYPPVWAWQLALLTNPCTSTPLITDSEPLIYLSHRFAINLRCAESESSDIALHFNPRFDGKDKVVFNAFKDGSWGSEEFYQMPHTKGEAFEVVIKATSEAYKVRQSTDGTV